MTKNKQNKNTSPAITDSTSKSGFSHWVRVVVGFLSFGFIFPNALTENDIVEHSTGKEAKTRTKTKTKTKK